MTRRQLSTGFLPARCLSAAHVQRCVSLPESRVHRSAGQEALGQVLLVVLLKDILLLQVPEQHHDSVQHGIHLILVAALECLRQQISTMMMPSQLWPPPLLNMSSAWSRSQHVSGTRI